MNLEYDWGKKELVEELKKRRMIFNIVAFIISVIIYFSFVGKGISSDFFDNKWMFVFCLIYITVVLLILFLTTKLYIAINVRRNKKNFGKYNIVIDDNTVSVKFNDQEIKYNLDEVILKLKKDYFKIFTKKDKIGLTFRKKLLGYNYDVLLERFFSNINK